MMNYHHNPCGIQQADILCQSERPRLRLPYSGAGRDAGPLPRRDIDTTLNSEFFALDFAIQN